MDSKYKEAYQQLGLDDSGASWADVRTSYRRKVQRLHPDRVEHTEHAAANQEQFILVTRAYKLLNEYHRENHALPRDYQPETDPAMQVDLGDFEKISHKEIAGVVESIQYDRQGTSVLKIVLTSCALALIAAMGIMSFAAWQKSQVPPITPFTTDKPMPLSTEALNSDEL